jgi:polysaccharide pyruvyl transferase WcaK-like protein
MTSYPPHTERAGSRLTPWERVEKFYFCRWNSAPFSREPFSMLPAGNSVEPTRQLMQTTYFSPNNAGDRFLNVALRDAFSSQIGPIDWKVRQVHRPLGGSGLAKINATGGLVIGGGGLFIRDSNPGSPSGWQWSCSVEELGQITAPIVVFAVGYNRFRGQPEFEPQFTEHLRKLVEKSVFFGLRNTGSIEAIRSYLPEELHERVILQPCPTTALRGIYPERFEAHDVDTEQLSIALNCAFDRRDLRYGDREDEILTHIADAMKRLSTDFPIRYYIHVDTDELMLPYLKRAGIECDVYYLHRMPAEDVIAAYSDPVIAIGMRGHSQMIPLGCGRPIVSLAAHDKLLYFLDDIAAPEWGIDVREGDLSDGIVDRVVGIASNIRGVDEKIRRIGDDQWAMTKANLATIGERVVANVPGRLAG